MGSIMQIAEIFLDVVQSNCVRRTRWRSVADHNMVELILHIFDVYAVIAYIDLKLGLITYATITRILPGLCRRIGHRQPEKE